VNPKTEQVYTDNNNTIIYKHSAVSPTAEQGGCIFSSLTGFGTKT
jgi:hypothetical protein